MRVITEPSELSTELDGVRKSGQSIGFVPTMGYLHAGHLSLFNIARTQNDVVVVSIFVNPTQFGANEDLDRYPRDFEADQALCEASNVDILFCPSVDGMYPDGLHANDKISVGEMSTKLCGRFRPGHFDGVTTIMAKFFTIVGSCRCYLGKKDAQQVLILQKLVAERYPSINIVTCPTIRENGGLALSSRNAYLSQENHTSALSIYLALDACARGIESGTNDIDSLCAQACTTLESAGLSVQYCELVDRSTLDHVPTLNASGEYLLCVAVMAGTTRLIDNFFIDVVNGSATVDRGIDATNMDGLQENIATEAPHA